MEGNQKTERTEGPAVQIPTVKSLFIQAYFDDQLISSTTYFLLSRTKESHLAVLTNRHVVTGRHQETGECLDKRHGAVPNAVVIHFTKAGAERVEWQTVRLPLYRPDGSPYWIEHPRLGAKADVVALNLSWGSDVVRQPYYLDLNLDRIQMVLLPAEPVSVIGFPFGPTSSARFPIWATGFLAQDLELVTPDRPTFYIDCRSRPGQSGSPVIAFRTQGIRSLSGGQISTRFAGSSPAWEFLGIYSGRVNPESALGVVWHVSILGELIDATATDEEIRAHKARMLTQLEEPPVP